MGIGRAFNAIGFVALAGLVSSCASFVGPRNVEIPLYKLQAGLERRFPVDNRMLELIDVRLSRPQLAVLPENDRVGLTMEAEIAPPFLKRAYNGSVAFSGRLYVDPSRSAVFMTDARVDRFELDGVDSSVQRQFTKLANFAMDQIVREMPVYAFRSEDLRYAGVQFVPTRIATTGSGLVVTLEPVK
jgi:Protein of unknown function (DUF1439)